MTTFTVTFVDKTHTNARKLSFQKGESLLLLCEKAGIVMARSCNGKGICGQCKVRFVMGAPLPTLNERHKLTADELRFGVRLACTSRLTGDCTIEVESVPQMDVVSHGVDVSWGAYCDDAATEDAIGVDKELAVADYFFVADIGTTTIVMEKRSVATGEVLATYKDLNAQRSFGADVISRMEASMESDAKRAEMASLIQRQLETGIQVLGGAEHVACMVVAGNTTMVHLLMGYDAKGLSKAPFLPVTLDEIQTEIAGIATYVMPGFSAFVGGDLWADALCVSHLQTEQTETCSLIIDFGTNAELILKTPQKDYSTACAAGCAFDQPGAGYFGSDMIALLAKLKRDDKIDVHGILVDEDPILQHMIQDILLAKAAIRTGIEVLVAKAGITLSDITKVYLAGGFGYYLNPQDAALIGLLPEVLVDVSEGMGNMVLPGASLYAREILKRAKEGTCDSQESGQQLHYRSRMVSINLAMEPSFNETYIGYLDLP